MKTELRRIVIIFLTLFLFSNTYAQVETTTDFFNQIKSYDLSTILMVDSILTENGGDLKEEYVQNSELMGFIGNDYQRLDIHFVSIIQNPTNPYEYFVYGKTKVKETICSFHGTITIRQARIYKIGDISTYKQGFTNCDVILFEDKKQPSTGFIKGKMESHFLIDDKGRFRYDAIALYSDSFSNNQFVGSWTSYKTDTSKKCNWGDNRIPDCGDLDIGAGEFSVNNKYLKNGWANYMIAWGTDQETSEVKQARQKENEQWWK